MFYVKILLFSILGGDPGNFQSKTPILTEAKRWRSLSCPSYCSKDASPVCGSDGVIYMNDCERRKRTCNQSKSNSILNQTIIFTLEHLDVFMLSKIQYKQQLLNKYEK